MAAFHEMIFWKFSGDPSTLTQPSRDIDQCVGLRYLRFRRKELKTGMEMTDSPVIFEKDGRLALITLNRPKVLNAIDDRIPRLLQDAVD